SAIREKADMIGLSGLITPSLEEMAFVAGEMEREGFTMPLLVGGATTSKVHTAVKIEPHYSGPVVHVLDASRAVGVASALLSDGQRESFARDVRAEYKDIRVRRAERRRDTKTQTLAQARANKVAVDWSTVTPPVPKRPGISTYDESQFPLGDLVPRIDWTPFFQAWELAGHYPDILEDPTVGASARSVFSDAQEMLRKIVEEKWLKVRAVVGFFPANSDGAEDICIWPDERRSKMEDGRSTNGDKPIAVVHTIRQQMVKPDGRANVALADFVAPCSTGLTDWMGFFAVTTGIGVDKKVAEFAAVQDDYSAIMVKALADRLAEALAERLHERVRREFWGYAPNEHLDNSAIIREQYQGIRPAPGYPACPDHTEKRTLFDILGATERAGIELTESFAMFPTAAVSGYYFWNPESRYYGVGKIERDQVEDYARRKGMELKDIERWLAPVLAYDR
ncbi:MAG: vitamin B12 dependent-methionine synthase activation domain-containing protein, partial [Gemmatimonadales bacterium]